MIPDFSRFRPSSCALLAAASATLLGAATPDGMVEAQSAPAVERVVFLGLATGDSTYFRGEAVRVRIAFTRHVVVSTTNGDPYVALSVGTNVRRARFVTSKLNRLDFSYTVQSADYDADGVSVAANALKLNGASIKARDTPTVDANAAHGAVAGGASRKVDGSKAQAPKIRSVTFNSSPAAGDTYGYGEAVSARVAFDRPVLVSTTGGTPRLALTVGAHVRQAALSNSAGTHRRLNFSYVVQGNDQAAGGVRIAANALDLNGGTIKAGADGTTNAVLTHSAVAADSTRKIDGSRGRPPKIDRVAFLDPKPKDSTYWRGDTIVVRVGFDAKVAVDTTNGKPQVGLAIGTATRQAVLSARGDETLDFSYVVQSADADADGAGIAANALALNGGAITGTGAAASRAADLVHPSVDGGESRKVDGSQVRAPTIDSVVFVGPPPADGAYHYDKEIIVRVAFDRRVVVDTVGGKPQLEVTIGARRRQAVVAAPASAAAVLDFTYRVQSADLDLDGASIAANALALNGGAIKAATDGTTAAGLAHGAIAGATARKVDGRPRIVTIDFMQPPGHPPPPQGIFKFLETMWIGARFDQEIAMTGTPRISLVVGTDTVQVGAKRLAQQNRAVVFQYKVGRGIKDPDGVSVPKGALDLNGGTLKAVSDNVTNANLDHGGAPPNASYKVDGNLTPVPGARIVWRNRPASGDTFGRGERIQIMAVFHTRVVVTGRPQLSLKIGTQTKQLTATGADAWGPMFEYVVQAEDQDTDGVSVPANTLSLPSGATIQAAADISVAAALAHDSLPANTSRKVNGALATAPIVRRVTIHPDPSSDSTYTLHEQFNVNVTFDRAVVVDTTDGRPRIALDIGNSTRYAMYSHAHNTSAAFHVFNYTVQASDVDADGISIAANALSANGGSITAPGETAAADLSHGALAADSARKVNGGRTGGPRPRWLWFSGAPASGDTYRRGEWIKVDFSFDRKAVVDTARGVPYVEIDVGGTRRRASYVGGSSPASHFRFVYVVQAADVDADGVGVPANTLTANGGSITGVPGAATAAVLSHDSLPANAAHKVNGGLPPRVLRMSIGPDPSSDSTYTLHEGLVVTVGFDRAVVVDTTAGRPRIALDIGSSTRYATYSHAHNSSELLQMFTYTVQASDVDADGISIAANALSANGGSITAPGETAAADLSHGALAADSARKVNGGRTGSPRPRWLWLSSAPASGDTYRRGEWIKVDFTFDRKAVVDTAGGVPYVEIDVGGTRRRASYKGGSEPSLFFRFVYVVQAADVDADGVSVPASTLSANGGSITGVPGAATAAVLTHDSLPANAAHKVNGGLPPRVRRMSIGPDPSSDNTYTLHEQFNVNVGFDRAVVVDTTGGRPRIALDIGGSTRYAMYSHAHNSSAALHVFNYTVQASDVDADGISIAANALSANGGSITAPGETAAADLSHSAVAADSARKVNGGRTGSPRPRWLWLGSAPASGDTYRQGESIKVEFSFDRKAVVDIAGGVPYVEIDIGGTRRRASYASGPSPRTNFRFVYVVQAADVDADGVKVPANTLSANGGSITGVPGAATAAVLSHDSLPTNAAHKVNGGPAAVSANRKPEVVASMAQKAFEVGSVPVADDLSAYFRDPDGDELGYAAVSAAQAVATAVIAGNVLTIRPQGVGQSLVTVRAADPAGAEAEQSFLVTVEASRSDRARILKQSLAAFGRTVGAEAVEAIGGRLGAGDEARALGQSHFRLGGQSLSCDAASSRHGCGLRGLASRASGLLGVRLAPGVDRLVSALHDAASGGLDADAARELERAFGRPRFDAGGAASASGHNEDVRWGRLLSLNPLSRRDLLSRASFRFSPGGGGQAGGRQSDHGGWTFWGRANTGGFKGRPADDLVLDATVRSAYLGADYRFVPGPLVGLALSRTTSAVGFESGINGAGMVDASLTSLYPYVRWSPRTGLDVWGLLGAGRGDAAMSEDATGRRFETKIGMFMTAVGARQRVVGALAFKADAFAVRTDAGEAGDLAGVAANAYRLRLAPEIGGSWSVSEQASVRSRAELGARIDGGDAETGVGAEAGVELAYAHEGLGLHVGFRGRTLVAHQAEAFKDWGASMSVRLQPGRGPAGLSLRLEPTWGAVASGMATLWRDGTVGPPFGQSYERAPTARTDGAGTPNATAGRLDVQTSYAIVVPDFGQIEPFGRWALERESGYRLNVGVRLSALSAADGSPGAFRATFDLFGEQATRGMEPVERRLGLRGAIQFK